MSDPPQTRLTRSKTLDSSHAVSEWKTFGERVLYDNPWVRLVKVDVEPPDGMRFEHHVVRLNKVSVVLVLNDRDEVLMLWRHRFVTDQWGWELPGGIVDEGETHSEPLAGRSKKRLAGVQAGCAT